MNGPSTYDAVIQSADRFGPDNPQQLKRLLSLLQKRSPADVCADLLRAFLESPSPHQYPRQKLAGILLHRLTPKAEFDLRATLLELAPHYNHSVHELPVFLAGRFTISVFHDVVLELLKTSLAPSSRAALETMLRWLKLPAPPPA